MALSPAMEDSSPVKKNLGGGTVFRVFFPALEQEVVAEVEPVEVAPLGTERILLVDDEEMLAELGKTILEGLGYEVTALTSSLDALALFQNHPDHSTRSSPTRRCRV